MSKAENGSQSRKLQTTQVVAGILLLIIFITGGYFVLHSNKAAAEEVAALPVAEQSATVEDANTITVDAESMARAQDWWANVEGVSCTHAFGAYWACKYPADTVEGPEVVPVTEQVSHEEPIPVK